ncbi:MAG: XkdX family protein [Sarcina sp.]|nr:XkdX family protein [Sarcina sp.]
MASKFYNIAKKNYPENWNLDMMKNLVRLGRITVEEYEEITGLRYEDD